MTALKIELKAYKMLAQLREKLLSRIVSEARTKVEYCKDKPKEAQILIGYISNPAKWDYCGLLSEEDKNLLEVIEYLLNDDANEIKRYGEWKLITERYETIPETRTPHL